jgi:predicted RNA methylase
MIYFTFRLWSDSGILLLALQISDDIKKFHLLGVRRFLKNHFVSHSGYILYRWNVQRESR